MHNITKIKIFRILLWITWLPSFLLLYPLALLKKKQSSGLFFFFDRYSLGGAQKVHLDILEAVEDRWKTVFFTRRSPDHTMFDRFSAIRMTQLKDIHFWCDNLVLRLFSIHYFSFYLNRHDQLRILSSNSTFFYDMLPFLKRSSFTVELLHNFTYGKKGMEFFGLMNHQYLSVRTTIDSHTRNQIIDMYSANGISGKYGDRVRVIEFGVAVPEVLSKPASPPLVICYAGRGGPQKRVWLINRIAEYFIAKGASVQFRFAGTFEDELSPVVKNTAEILGVIPNEDGMRAFFSSAHVLLMTSAYEGFPVVIKESLANGCVPVVPALPGIQTHLINLKNALLIADVSDEASVVKEGIGHIERLLADNLLLEKLSGAGNLYAKAHFDKRVFLESYHLLLS